MQIANPVPEMGRGFILPALRLDIWMKKKARRLISSSHKYPCRHRHRRDRLPAGAAAQSPDLVLK
ncbi:hypothetical protein [Paracoccus sp. (in: a-proteobacteria)]|uniref:hypothetical protein n=1 Tax=Paracoccus sp. TaxID=267 RepID=UPI0035AE8528